MGQTHIQTRVPDKLADRIDDYQENKNYMNQAEALRALLREGLAHEGYTDEERTDAGGQPDGEPDAVWRMSGLISTATLLLYIGIIGGWLLSVPFSIVPLTDGLAVTLVLGTLIALCGTILSIVLGALYILTTDKPVSSDRLDLRRVVAHE